MKKNIIILLVAMLFVILLSNCNHTSSKVQLHQDADKITKVILVDNTGLNNGIDPINLLIIEDKDSIFNFIESLYSSECGKYFNDPSVSYGYLYVEIHYVNGDTEIIGTDSFQYNSVDGTIKENYNGWLYVKFNSMCELFKEYAGVEPTIPT